MRGLKFFANEYYHIYNRGVEKRDIFLDQSDYLRFLFALQKMNKEGRVYNFCRGVKYLPEEPLSNPVSSHPLVRILCYCLMPNHYHLVLRSFINDGAAKFMHKIGTSYTNYFNRKYQHSGVLFQGTFRAKHIEDESYLLQLSRYVHLNPGDLEKHLLFIRNYPWSSYRMYLDPKHRGIVELDKTIIDQQFSTSNSYTDFVESPLIEA